MLSSFDNGGSRVAMALANMLLPTPGGPLSKILWWPAAAISMARLARSWPTMSSNREEFESVGAGNLPSVTTSGSLSGLLRMS